MNFQLNRTTDRSNKWKSVLFLILQSSTEGLYLHLVHYVSFKWTIGLITLKKIHIPDKTVENTAKPCGNSCDYHYGYANKKLKLITVKLYRMERRIE